MINAREDNVALCPATLPSATGGHKIHKMRLLDVLFFVFFLLMTMNDGVRQSHTLDVYLPVYIHNPEIFFL